MGSINYVTRHRFLEMDIDRDTYCAADPSEVTVSNQPFSHQPHHPPQPPYYPPPKKKKTTWPWLIIPAIVLLCGFGGCFALMNAFDSATDTSTTAPGGEGPAPVAAEEETAPAGSAVRDGKFEFVVTEVETGLPTVGTNEYLQSQAQGQYVLVHATVTNISSEPQSYFGDNQQLVDTQNRMFTNDTMAEMNVNDSATIAADINPGNQLDVVIAFDIPVDAQPAAIELHDSMFSNGTRVAIE